MKQMRIMRIDHHGWQIVLALVAMLAVLDERPRRSGMVAGAAMALWCNISIEALPFVAALGAWFAFSGLRRRGRGAAEIVSRRACGGEPAAVRR